MTGGGSGAGVEGETGVGLSGLIAGGAPEEAGEGGTDLQDKNRWDMNRADIKNMHPDQCFHSSDRNSFLWGIKYPTHVDLFR